MVLKRMPGEWEAQSFIQLAWPHKGTDWAGKWLDASTAYYRQLALLLSRYTRVVVVLPEGIATGLEDHANLSHCYCPTNDTWARDYAGISIVENGKPIIMDFTFNGWGGKFDSELDNRATSAMHKQGFFGDAELRKIDMVLEGGSIESNGKGTLLTTTSCLLNPNRNPDLSQSQVEEQLKFHLGVEKVLWLENGHLEGDDTDGHIDTLARFCNEHTLAYVGCDDPSDAHYQPLKAMEEELKTFGYDLVKLPFCSPIYSSQTGRRLPATYANFLITDKVVWVPSYGIAEDFKAVEVLKRVFAQRQVMSIDCRTLIEQSGALHCATMQFPLGFGG